MIGSFRQRLSRISENVFRVSDTCNVYVLRSGREGIAIDLGSGDVLDMLDAMDIGRLTDVLVTHHHRDQVGGLDKAIAAGVRVWVPPVEQDLFRFADELWQARRLDNDYDVRQDRFGPLSSVDVTGILDEYAPVRFGDHTIVTLPTPGHTLGSVTFLSTIDGQRMAFSGDLIAAPGKVWSMAATQWTYNGIEGVGATWYSARELMARDPELVLPSHGEPIREPAAAFGTLTQRLMRLVRHRGFGMVDLDDLWDRPFETLTPHLLQNRTSISRSYALLSDSGKALIIDFGYDFATGSPPAGDRSSRRPLLATIDRLKRDHGIDRIDVAVPTHYHDDHVAGFNLLREVEGTEVWAAASFSEILRDPSRFDLPCLWYDPIGVDRSLPLETPISWQEYELRLFDLPGHTLYACAIAFEVDGKTVVASGDQQGTMPGVDGEFLNYTYRNRFGHRDFRRSAELYRRLRPDLLISGHWDPRPVTDGYLQTLLERGREIEDIHEDLLPLDSFDLGAEGVAAWIRPYRSVVLPRESVQLAIEIRNPFRTPGVAVISLVVPDAWTATPSTASITIGPASSETVHVQVTVGGDVVRRARIACDLTIDGFRLGLAAEALVTVVAQPAALRPLRVVGRPDH